ncbi:MAG: hypothetical protein AB7S38_17155 [Vulcanimicrobiota bacterium]
MLKRLQRLALSALLALALLACEGGDGATGAPQTVSPPTSLSFLSQPQRTAGTTIPNLQVAILDQNGQVVTQATNPVTISLGSNPGGATLAGTTTQNAVNGVATFNDLSLDRVSTGYTLVASSPGLQGATSNSFAITPATAGQLTFLVQPSNVQVNQPINPPVQVEARDAFGNLTNATVTITLGNNPGGTTLSGTTQLTTTDGVATFPDLVLDRGGAGYTLVATSDTGIMAASDAFGGLLRGILVGDTLNRRVVQFDDLNGSNWTTLDVPARPYNSTRDGQGKIYFTASDSRIRRVDDITGANLLSLGDAGNRVNEFSFPTSPALDGQGRIYLVDGGNSRIVRMDDLTGTNWTTFGSLGNGVNQFDEPNGLALDAAGRIYVADTSNSRLVRFDDMTGTNWTTFGTVGPGVNQFFLLADVALDASGRIYVTDRLNHRIARFDDMTGTNWVTFGSMGNGINQFQRPVGLDVGTGGQIFVADSDNSRIIRFDDMAGSNWTVFGTQGSGVNQFDRPFDVDAP